MFELMTQAYSQQQTCQVERYGVPQLSGFLIYCYKESHPWLLNILLQAAGDLCISRGSIHCAALAVV